MDGLENLILAILTVAGIAFYYKRKADKAGQDAVMGETRGQDKVLKENQDAARREVNEAAEEIKRLITEREKESNEPKSREERAAEWNKDKK